jgi:hypothetical protein
MTYFQGAWIISKDGADDGGNNMKRFQVTENQTMPCGVQRYHVPAAF